MKIKTVIVFLLIGLFLNSCSYLERVQPYEKEYFAQEKMSLSPLPARAEQSGHIFLIREASAGGDSAFQGGCGCR